MWRKESSFPCIMRKKQEKKKKSLYFRSCIFLTLLTGALIFACVLVMYALGVFDQYKEECQMILQNQLDHFEHDISKDFGELSLQGITLAKQISEQMDQKLEKNDVTSAEFFNHTELFEEVISDQMPLLISALTNYQCSGIYIMLDATINPEKVNASYSKYGVFLKQTEVNDISAVPSKIYYLRGPAEIARKNKIELLAQWRMEFEITEQEFFQEAIDIAKKNTQLPLSRLYYWSSRVVLKGNSESGILLCVPLISKDNIVYGLCGFEISAMLFKLMYSPDNSTYPRIFSSIAPYDVEFYHMDDGLLAGNSYLNSSLIGATTSVNDENGFYERFDTQKGQVYYGVHKKINLYPSDSPYVNQQWNVAVMIPKEDMKDVDFNSNLLLKLALLIILIMGVFAGIFISRKNIAPIMKVLNSIQKDDISNIPKSKYLEINDLIEFLAAKDNERDELYNSKLQEQMERARKDIEENYKEKLATEMKECSISDRKVATPNTYEVPLPNLDVYREFVNSIGTLSAAERSVFDLYMKGHTAQEI